MRPFYIVHYLNFNGDRWHKDKHGSIYKWKDMSAGHLMNTVRLYRRLANNSLLRYVDYHGKARSMELYAVIRERAWA